MKSKNMSTIPVKELRELFDSVDNVLCDNDGVLSVFGALLPGVTECVNKLLVSGKSVKIITNNTAFGREYLSTVLNKQGLAFQQSDVITPTCAMTNYLKSIHFKGKVWIMGSNSMQDQFKQDGFRLAESEEPKFLPLSEVQKYYGNIDPEIKAIIVDVSLNTTVGNIAKAIKYLYNDPGLLLIFGGTDSAIPIAQNEHIIGPYYFQNIITDVTKREPIRLGKPCEGFGKYIIETLHCEPTRTLFIGDSLKQDICFAKRMGFKELLVLSGNTKIEELNNCQEEYRPTYYISSMDELNSCLAKCYS